MSISAGPFNSLNINNFQQEIILQAPIPIFVVEGSDFIISISNEKNLKKWQRTPEEVLGKPLFDVFPEGKTQPFYGFLTDVYQKGIGIKRNEVKAEFYRNGVLDTAWFDINYEPIKNEKGEVFAIMAISVEITTQVLAHKKAENSANEFRQMADAMPHLVWTAGDKGNILFCNSRVYEYCGLNNDTDKSFLWKTVLHPEDLEKTQKVWKNALDNRILFSVQHRIKMKNGLYRWFLSRAVCEENIDDNTVKWFGSSTDVREQEQNESKIKQTEEFNRTILESNPDCLKVIDKDGKIQYMNLNGQYLMEIDDFTKFKDKPWGELWSEENKGIIKESIEKALLGENVQFIAQSSTAKGNLKWWDVTVSPVNNSNGEVKEILSISRDITYQKLIEEKIIETRELFERTLLNIPSAIYHFDKEGNILYANELAAYQMGYNNVEELLIEKDFTHFRKTVDERFELFDEKGKAIPSNQGSALITLNSGKSSELVVKFINRKTKDSFWLLNRSVPLTDDEGNLTNVFTSCTDISEQKFAEEDVQKSESRYRRIFENTPVSIWEEDFSSLKKRIDQLSQQGIVDFDAYFKIHYDELVELIDSVVIKDVNAASLKLYNCSKKEILQGLRQFYTPETLPTFVDGFKIIAQGGGHYEAESIVKNKAGELINLMVFIDFPSHEDDYSSVQVIRFDITERKKIEKSIHESEEKYRGLFEKMEQGFCIVEVVFDLENNPIDYRFVESNPMFKHQTGIDNPDGKTISELVPDIEVSWSQIYGKVVLTGESTLFTDYSEAMNTWFEVYAFRLGDKNNNKVAILFTNITERKKAELEIKASEEKFRLLTETIPQMVWMTDAVGTPEYLSSQWEKYAGTMNMADYWEIICHPDDIIISLNAWQKSISTGNKYISEIRLKNKEGEYRWHVSVGVPLKNDKDEIIKWIGSVTDIHHQKLKEQKKDEFISIASHEMKTPLTSAKAYLQLMEMTLDQDHDAYLYTQKASDAVERLNKLISELLDASKIQHGKLNYTNSAFDFDIMVADTIENVQYSSATHKIIKKGAIRKHFWGDKDRLQQVIINLLTNAIKYSPDANEVSVVVQEANDYLQVSVTDKGIGMPEKHLERVFERYYRVEEHSVQFQGLGIGLYISYDIIKRHDGKMWVESNLGEGSTFHFTLPFIH